MSLEQSINELNTNIVALIAALGAAPVQAKPAAAKVDKPKAEPVKEVAKEVAKAEQTAAEQPAAEPAAEAPTVTEDDCKQITLQLASKKGRDAAVAVLSEFGVAKASELKADQLAEYHAAATAALGA